MEITEDLITKIASKARNIAGINPNTINLNIETLVSGLKIQTRPSFVKHGYRLIYKDNQPIVEIGDTIKDADKLSIALLIGLHYIKTINENIDSENESFLYPSQATLRWANSFAEELLMPKDNFIAIAKEYYDEATNAYDLFPIADAFDIDITDIYTRGVELHLFSELEF